MFLNFHVASYLYEFMGKNYSQLLITLPCLVAIGQVHVKI